LKKNDIVILSLGNICRVCYIRYKSYQFTKYAPNSDKTIDKSHVYQSDNKGVNLSIYSL